MTNLPGANLHSRAATARKGEGQDGPSNFPRYPEYKDSGVQWLGEVPAHWDVTQLRYAISGIESGTSVNATDLPAEEGEVGVLKTSCVYRGFFEPAENKRVVPEEVGRVSCPLKKDSLIVSRMNTPDLIGAVGLVNSVVDGIYLPDRLWQISFNDRALPGFTYFWASSVIYRAQVQVACAGTSSSMQNLSQDSFRGFWLALPSLDEQAEISDFLKAELRKIDGLVLEQEKLISLLKEKRQAVISHAVTRGLDPNVPMKDSGIEWLGRVPAHWMVKRVKNDFFIGRGRVISQEELIDDGLYPVFSSQTLNDGCLGYINAFDFDCTQITWTTDGANAGTVFVRRGKHNCTNVCGTLLPKKDSVSVEYVGNYLTYATQFYKRPDTNGAKIMNNEMAGIALLLPPIGEQEVIAGFLAAASFKLDALHEVAERGIVLLNERRAALISAAVTGKIDVRQLKATEAA